MILDFRNDYTHAVRHDVIDAKTGEVIDLPIFYADDESGVVRYYVKDDRGMYLLNADKTAPMARELNADIRIVPKR